MYDLIENAMDCFVNSESKYESGVDARFKKSPIDGRWGYKVYFNRFKREKQYWNQYLASKHGLAPKVGKRFHFRDWDISGYSMYGFLTEACEMTLYEYGKKVFGRDFIWNTRYNLLEEAVNTYLYQGLEKIGIIFHDSHARNIMCNIVNGSPVWYAVDLGHANYIDGDEEIEYPTHLVEEI